MYAPIGAASGGKSGVIIARRKEREKEKTQKDDVQGWYRARVAGAPAGWH